MAITADSFRAEHFDALTRGLEAARGAFERVEEERDNAVTEWDECVKSNVRLQNELYERVRQETWDELIELIEDVGRGVRTLDELLAHVRAL